MLLLRDLQGLQLLLLAVFVRARRDLRCTLPVGHYEMYIFQNNLSACQNARIYILIQGLPVGNVLKASIADMCKEQLTLLQSNNT